LRCWKETHENNNLRKKNLNTPPPKKKKKKHLPVIDVFGDYLSGSGGGGER
jgi:hypothetical protein